MLCDLHEKNKVANSSQAFKRAMIGIDAGCAVICQSSLMKKTNRLDLSGILDYRLIVVG